MPFSPNRARRRFLAGGLAAAALTRRAFAQDRAAAPRSVAAPSVPRSPHVGMNLAGLAYYGTGFPFADLMKQSEGFKSRDARGAEKGELRLSLAGYPLALESGQRAWTPVVWDDTGYARGDYVVRWDGDGEVGFPNSNVGVKSRAPGRLVLDVRDAKAQIWVSIEKTNPADPLRNLRFFWPGTENAPGAPPFNPEFLKRLAPFGTLRFMDWGATNHSPQVRWADRPQPGDMTYATPRGVPLEVMLDLANALQSDAWLCLPHQADDDYVRRWAGLVQARLDPRAVALVEYSNEVWNGSFGQGRYAVEQARRLGLPMPHGLGSIFYAERVRQVAAIVDEVFGAAGRSRWTMVAAGQAVWTQFGADALAWKDTASKVGAYAIAPYFGAHDAADPAKVEATLALAPDALLEQMRADIRGGVKRQIDAAAALATKHGLKLHGYEGGAGDNSEAFPGPRQDAMTALFAAAHRHPRMREIYREYYETWIGAGGALLNQFNDIGRWSKWGLWGVLESVTQDPATAPKYQGLLDAIAAHPRKVAR